MSALWRILMRFLLNEVFRETQSCTKLPAASASSSSCIYL